MLEKNITGSKQKIINHIDILAFPQVDQWFELLQVLLNLIPGKVQNLSKKNAKKISIYY